MPLTNLTATDVQAIFECLGAYQGGTVTAYDYNDKISGAVSSVPIQIIVDFSTATTTLNSILAVIDAATDGRWQRLHALAVKYIDVADDTERITTGGTSAAPGLRYDPMDARARARENMFKITGFIFKVNSAVDNPSPGYRNMGGGHGGASR